MDNDVHLKPPTVMNRFYGKLVSEMNFHELTLLSIDLQILSYDKVNNIPTHVIEQSFTIRDGFMLKCGEGDYTRERFLCDVNGGSPRVLESVFDEFTEVELLLE